MTHALRYGKGKLVDSQFDDTSETMFQCCAERYFEHVPLILHSAFEQSQIYVACKYHPNALPGTTLIISTVSRARSLQGLTVTALPNKDLGGANAQVKEFMDKIVMKKKTEL